METLTKSVVIKGRTPTEVFEYCLDAANFPKIFPERIAPIGNVDISDLMIELGREFHFRHWIFGVLPVHWHVRITELRKHRFFVDEMLKGPLKYFRHTHTVAPVLEGTLYTDSLRYAAFGGSAVTRLIVTPYMNRIFARRHQNMKRLLET